jgi:hypothetical protein
MEIDDVLFKKLTYPLILTYDLEAYYHAFFVAFIIIFRYKRSKSLLGVLPTYVHPDDVAGTTNIAKSSS